MIGSVLASVLFLLAITSASSSLVENRFRKTRNSLKSGTQTLYIKQEKLKKDAPFLLKLKTKSTAETTQSASKADQSYYALLDKQDSSAENIIKDDTEINEDTNLALSPSDATSVLEDESVLPVLKELIDDSQDAIQRDEQFLKDQETFHQLLANPPARIFSQADDGLFALTLALDPTFRAPPFTVNNMNDFKCVHLFIKPSFGSLFGYFCFQFDHVALMADCRTQEDFDFLARNN